jgi:anti-sigma28 factor (negative regulator of flagellin synthesis)
MQVLGEELIRTAANAETRHNGDNTATLEAPDTMVGSGSGTTHRAAWVRVARTGSNPTVASNKPRQREEILSSEPITTAERHEIDQVLKSADSAPDVREGIVASLRERIESGTYFVGSDTIAEMMMRRTLADRLR